MYICYVHGLELELGNAQVEGGSLEDRLDFGPENKYPTFLSTSSTPFTFRTLH